MPASELGHIAVQMLGAEFMEGAPVSAFQHRPKRLDPIGVDFSAHILPDAVLYGPVI